MALSSAFGAVAYGSNVSGYSVQDFASVNDSSFYETSYGHYVNTDYNYFANYGSLPPQEAYNSWTALNFGSDYFTGDEYAYSDGQLSTSGAITTFSDSLKSYAYMNGPSQFHGGQYSEQVEDESTSSDDLIFTLSAESTVVLSTTPFTNLGDQFDAAEVTFANYNTGNLIYEELYSQSYYSSNGTYGIEIDLEPGTYVLNAVVESGTAALDGFSTIGVSNGYGTSYTDMGVNVTIQSPTTPGPEAALIPAITAAGAVWRRKKRKPAK